MSPKYDFSHHLLDIKVSDGKIGIYRDEEMEYEAELTE